MNGVQHEEYVQLQLLNQQVQELELSINQAQEQIDHVLVANQVLETLKEAKKDQDLLVPLGSGAFLEVQAKDVKNVKLVVGANVVVEKSVPETIKTITSQLHQLQQYQEKSVQLYQQVVEKINVLQQQIESKMKQ